MSVLRKPALFVLAGAALWAAASGPAVAEVFALVNPDGSYAATRIVRTPDSRSPWTPLGLAESRRLVLNPGGERRGDGSPVIAHNPATGLPFVSWSTASPTGKRDVQVAAFDGTEWVLLPPVGLAGGDDLDPDLLVLPNGILVVVWTHGRNNPTIWISMHSSVIPDGRSDPGWMRPVPVAPEIRAHSPRLVIQDGLLVVESVGRGRPAIRSDVISFSGVTATDGPMPLPPSGFPAGPTSPGSGQGAGQGQSGSTPGEGH